MMFNKKWMDNINPALLERYWMKKGCKGILKTVVYGCTILHIKTLYGITLFPEVIKMGSNIVGVKYLK